jgi:hypothetical protein
VEVSYVLLFNCSPIVLVCDKFMKPEELNPSLRLLNTEYVVSYICCVCEDGTLNTVYRLGMLCFVLQPRKEVTGNETKVVRS